MRRPLKKIRKSEITKEEIIADLIFIFISAFISSAIVFLFDIHQSFYTWPIVLKFSCRLVAILLMSSLMRA